MEVNFSNDSTASMTPWGSIGVQLEAEEACWRGRSSQELLDSMSILSYNFTLKLLTFAPHNKHCVPSCAQMRRNRFRNVCLICCEYCICHLFYYSTVLNLFLQFPCSGSVRSWSWGGVGFSEILIYLFLLLLMTLSVTELTYPSVTG